MDINEKVKKLKAVIENMRLDMMIVYGGANVRYFTGYQPFLGDSMLIIKKDNTIKLFNRFEWDVSSVPLEFRDDLISSYNFAPEIIKIAGDNSSRVGVTGVEFMPFKIYCSIVSISNNIIEMDEEIAKIRIIKSNAEIELIKHSVGITEESISSAVTKIREDISESELGAIFEYEVKRRNIPELAFGSSVAFGKNSSNIAWVPCKKKLKKNEAIFFDVGARYQGYCSDIGRTYFFGIPSNEYTNLYNRMKMVQDEILAFIKPGMQVKEPYDKVVELFDKNNLGVPRHRLGHGIGIETSMEGPDLKYGDDVLEPNMVFAVEISHPGTLEGGIKIEDNVVLRKHGCELLSKSTRDLTTIK